MIRQHIYFSGRVQAVGFRFRAQMNATQLGLTGWVRNITDIEVEDIPVEKGERRFDVTY